MKIKSLLSKIKFVHAFALIPILMIPTLINLGITTGGTVHEIHSVTVNQVYEAPVEPEQFTTIADIQIDNNLPSYDLVISFPENAVDGVKLQGLSGTLGGGLTPPNDMLMIPGPEQGQFTWSPGNQLSATVGYHLLVRAHIKDPSLPRPSIMVSMPSPY